MARNLPDVRRLVKRKLKDDARYVDDQEMQDQIASALRKLNHDRPFILVVDITGDGSKDYNLPAPYEKGTSKILTVEHPAGEDIPVLLEEDDVWFEYEDPSQIATEQNRLRFLTRTPGVTETIRVRYQTDYTVGEATNVLDRDAFEALIEKTVSLLFTALAAKFNQSTDNGVEADSVDLGVRSQTYIQLANRHEKEYRKASGLDGEVGPAQAMAEADTRFSDGSDYPWHPAKTR